MKFKPVAIVSLLTSIIVLNLVFFLFPNLIFQILAISLVLVLFFLTNRVTLAPKMIRTLVFAFLADTFVNSHQGIPRKILTSLIGEQTVKLWVGGLLFVGTFLTGAILRYYDIQTYQDLLSYFLVDALAITAGALMSAVIKEEPGDRP